MSNQEMATRLHDILSAKASMGMGYGGRSRRMSRSYSEDMESPYGRAVYAGVGSKRGAKKNIWIEFLKFEAERTGHKYNEILKNKKLMERAKKNYCDFIREIQDEYPDLYRKSSCIVGSKKKISRSASRKKVSRTASKRKVSISSSKTKLVPKKECKPGMKIKEIYPKKKYTVTGKKRKPYLRCVSKK